ncbi:MAG: hypothetical protein AAF226_03015 [Verrucomicrobiota bacterium]
MSEPTKTKLEQFEEGVADNVVRLARVSNDSSHARTSPKLLKEWGEAYFEITGRRLEEVLLNEKASDQSQAQPSQSR